MTNFEDVDWSNLPKPEDDGAARHLKGGRLPSIALKATNGTMVKLSALGGLSVVYAYPMTGRPGVALPEGWDMIPGARGCTPQSCAFRDHFKDLKQHGVRAVFGLSSQPSEYQREAARRLHLPFPLLSDTDFALTDTVNLPTFDVEGVRLLKRLTMIIDEGAIIETFYPVFPPDRSVNDVLAWLDARGA
jgi:peroxiredoxin